MVSPAAAQKYGQDFGRNPVGTGPFRFQEWVLGNRVVVQRNEHYWDRARIQSTGIIFTDFEEPAVADARLRGGELDLVALEGLPADDLIAFQKDPSYRVVQRPAFRWEAIQMTSRPSTTSACARRCCTGSTASRSKT